MKINFMRPNYSVIDHYSEVHRIRREVEGYLALSPAERDRNKIHLAIEELVRLSNAYPSESAQRRIESIFEQLEEAGEGVLKK
jgi:hypothetical protein